MMLGRRAKRSCPCMTICVLFFLLQGTPVHLGSKSVQVPVLTHKCCNCGAMSPNQTRSITQEWRDLLTEISLYAVMIYTGEWFIEFFTLGTVVRECACACVCVCWIMHAQDIPFRTKKQ
jgi:hypothetical protein